LTSLWALAAAVALFVLLGLLGSRFAAALAAPADGLLYRGVIYTMAGTVALHLVLTALDFAGVRWSLPVLAASLLLIAGAATMASAPGTGNGVVGRGEGVRVFGREEFAWGDALALFALAVFTALALTGWIAMPDFFYHWGIKAYRFYLTRGVDYPYLAQAWNWSIHPEYPNLVPEMFAVTALLGGSFDVPAMMLRTAVLFALFVAACREGLRQGEVPPFVQQAGTALVALSGGAFAIGYIMGGAADWNLTLAFAAAVPPLLRPPDRTGDFQIAVIAAFAAASKLEGVPLGGFLVAVQVFRHVWSERRLNLKPAIAMGVVPAAVVLAWAGRATHHHLVQVLDSGRLDPARAGEIFGGVAEALWNPAWHGFLPIMLLPPLLLVSRRTRVFAVVATLELLFYFYVYFTSPVGNYRYFVLSNFARLGFQLIPACIVAALVAWEAAPKSERPAGLPSAGPPAAPVS